MIPKVGTKIDVDFEQYEILNFIQTPNGVTPAPMSHTTAPLGSVANCGRPR